MRWTDWKRLRLTPSFDATTLAETLDGGQSFRWAPGPADAWTGQWSERVIRIRIQGASTLSWSVPATLNTPDTEARLRSYLGGNTDWDSLVDRLPWRSDPHLEKAIGAFPGLRLLRQPIEDTLLGFLCSATKRIVQIKQMCRLLAENLGAEIAPGIRRMPTFTEIAAGDPATLNRCLLGFRARYILGTAQFLNERPGWLEETADLPYARAKIRLMELPGVGEKVADCVLLFGAGKLEAFPVDTWISRVMGRRYGLNDWSNRQLADFGRIHFGPAAGLAQQFLFSWERRFGQSVV